MSRDNWERLVAAVVKREQIWQLCHQDSFTTISSDFSQQILDLEDIYGTPPKNSSVSEGIQLGRLRRFSLHELRVATDNFSVKNLFIYGYSSKVYRGWLNDGSSVAVKAYRDGEAPAESQFQNELELNNIVVHPNVVRMLGFCITPKELLVVYPSIVNGSVASWLRDRNRLQPPLDWPIRKRIALGAARGLAYLHYECDKNIIHRDIRAANIWLDEDFEAVIAGLDLATVMDHDITHQVDTTIHGTIDHVAPEYLSSGTCSEKADVFGYGNFLLELITGQKAFDLAWLDIDKDMILLDWVKRNLKERKWEKLGDPDCDGNNTEEVVEHLRQVALLCIQKAPERRPKMSEIVIMLEIGDLLASRWEEWCLNEEMVELAYS